MFVLVPNVEGPVNQQFQRRAANRWLTCRFLEVPRGFLFLRAEGGRVSDHREAAQLESGIEHSAACLDGDSGPALLPGGPSISGGSRQRCCHSAGASADAAAHPAAGGLWELRDARRRQRGPAPNKAWQVGRGALCKYPSGLRTTEEGSRGGRGKRMDCSLIWTKRCFSQALWL